MELQAIAQGSGKPGPHCPENTPEGLMQALLSIAPLDSSSERQPSITTRIAKAHSKAREVLKTAAQMTDAYFLYTPSQIWFSAFLLADRPLAEFYLANKIGPAADGADGADGADADSADPLTLIRAKLVSTLSNCSQLLKSYKPISSDPNKRKRLKGIAKKVYQCQQVEKLESGSAQKRSSGTPTSTGPMGGVEAISESDMERVAKKRRLERERREKEAKDLFGGELLPQRNKELGRGIAK